MNDNTCLNRAQLVNNYLESKNIRRVDWPNRSPDFNSIKSVWDVPGRVTALRHSLPRIIKELKTALLLEWVRLLQILLNCLLSRVPSHYATCPSLRDHTPL
ncbi:DDE_3 domain-containing protein [Trichonephila clavipes]|nr:DDE_3 domain-containing protein [Trichonephila clavipes]